MSNLHTLIPNLATMTDIPQAGIHSQTLHHDEQIKVVLFGFAAGEELSEHTASMPALLQIISGQARLTLGDDTVEAAPGTWAHMAAHLPHSILAVQPTIMLLTLLKQGLS